MRTKRFKLIWNLVEIQTTSTGVHVNITGTGVGGLGPNFKYKFPISNKFGINWTIVKPGKAKLYNESKSLRFWF